MRRILLVDVDQTLTNEVCYTETECLNATPKKNIVQKVAQLYEEDFIVIYTARRDHLIPATLEWLRRNNIRWHAFSNLKIPGAGYIDDLAIHIDDIDKLLNEREEDTESEED